MAKVYSELEFGDEIWVITRKHVDNQFVHEDGRLVTITDDGIALWEDDEDLVAILPALDE